MMVDLTDLFKLIDENVGRVNDNPNSDKKGFISPKARSYLMTQLKYYLKSKSKDIKTEAYKEAFSKFNADLKVFKEPKFIN